MIELENGKNVKFMSKNGTTYWVHNINGSYYVETKYGIKRGATKEIRSQIKLVDKGE